MKPHHSALLSVSASLLLAQSSLAAPAITGVTAQQRYPWNGKVDITYTVSGAGEITAAANAQAAVPSLKVSATDQETGTTYTATSLSGDTGLSDGAHSLVWDMDAQGMSLISTNVTFSVSCETTPATYCVVDLSAGSSASSYPVAYLASPPSGGFNVDAYKTTKLVLKRIEAGSFQMGGSVNVTLTKPFFIGLFEMTQKQWKLVTGSNPSKFSGDKKPVEKVSYNNIRGSANGAKWPSSNAVDSSSFLGKLRARTGLDFDLPTEAQWEYACRAGTTTTYSYGSSANGDYMWYTSNSSDQTHEVGTKNPNPWGLYDMHGNVREWCLDWYARSLGGGTDPKGPSSGGGRVVRGGDWNSDASYCTSSNRTEHTALYGGDFNIYGDGFRLSKPLALSTAPAETLCSGVSSPVVIDLTTGTRTAALTETIRYSTSWETSAAGAQAVINIDGETVNTASGSGAFAWTPARNGTYTLTHRIMANGQQVGATLTAAFEFSHGPETPVITPADGTILEGTVNVVMSCATEGATIHYTTDGTEPTTNSPEYRRFRVSERTTVKAIAVKNGLCSEVAVAEYALGQCAAPVITAAASFTGSKTSVSLSCATEGATIRYTTDGGDPNSHSMRYTGPFEVTESCTVKAYATYESFFDSAISSFAIEKVWGIGDTMGDPDQSFTTGGNLPFVRVTDATAPLGESMKSGAVTDNQFSTLSTTVDGPGTVSFQWKTSCEDSGGAYDWDHAEFEVDGTVVAQLDGVTTWQTVSREISGDGPHEIVWRYTKDDISSEGEDCCWVADFAWETSSVPSAATPTITAASTFTGSKTSVTLSCATEGATIRYTTNGSNPNSHSTRYTGPFEVTNSCTVKAYATCAGYHDSSVATFAIEKVWGIGDTMGDPDQAFTVGGNAPFVRVDDATAPLGESMKSGAITHRQSSTLSTTVDGPGTASFQWKTSCENSGGEYDWDHAEFEVDGNVVAKLDGVTSWQTISREISSDGPHTLIWRYTKDDIESDGEDCCWVADFQWTPTTVPAITATQTTPEPVPYAWLRGFYPEISDEYEAYESAALATAANGRPVWECYVAGLDPTDATDDFIAIIEMVNDDPKISVGGRGERPGRVYTVEGKADLGDSWGPTNALSRFFHITVEVE